MVGHRYTIAEHEFLRAFIPGHTYKEIVAEYNNRFNEPITISRLKSYMSNHKINNGLTGRFKKGHIPANKGTHPPTVGRMAETQFKKGNLPPNTKPIGYERITKDGYTEVKVMQRPNRKTGEKNFKLKHRIIWEEHFGKIPKGYNVIFLDGDKTNFDINNLALLSDAENAQVRQKGLRFSNAELTKSGIAIIKLFNATNEKRQGGLNVSNKSK